MVYTWSEIYVNENLKLYPESTTKLILGLKEKRYAATTVILECNGYDCEIDTRWIFRKGLRSRLSLGTYKEIDANNTMFSSVSYKGEVFLCSSNKRALEKNVRALHEKGLQMFEQLVKEGRLLSFCNFPDS